MNACGFEDRSISRRLEEGPIVIPVHKKGSRMLCTNYNGIDLLSISGQLYATILDNRVR